jgi:DNA repair photolyase
MKMPVIRSKEDIANPLQKSALNKKGLCDYVVNIASGCLHGCTFCYVPSTPAIRTKSREFISKGVGDPQMDWGSYLFLREDVPRKLREKLHRQRSWHETPSGQGVVLLCSGTDPYQNKEAAKITRDAVECLLEKGKRVRILTRSPLWVKDISLLNHKDVTIGMSFPYSDDFLSRQIEPHAPPPSDRLKALVKGKEAGCRVYVAMAPTPPQISYSDFCSHLNIIKKIQPEVIFWEPINARGTNGKRMVAAGLSFAKSIMERKAWASYFMRQWLDVERAADKENCLDLLHIWPDRELTGFVDQKILDYWWYKPTPENWGGKLDINPSNPPRPVLVSQLEIDSLSS